MKNQEYQIETLATGLYKAHCDDIAKLNDRLLNGFLKHQEDTDIKRTHLFNGRYENIYLDENHIPELETVMNRARELANTILETSQIDCGYWFNYMPDGAVTTLHRHDDDDELLSAAYYVSVPAASGDLVVHATSGAVRVKPAAGEFIFFYPDVNHEVTENKSGAGRLSIGINFGIRHTD